MMTNEEFKMLKKIPHENESLPLKRMHTDLYQALEEYRKRVENQVGMPVRKSQAQIRLAKDMREKLFPEYDKKSKGVLAKW